jgi:hypothetical protein
MPAGLLETVPRPVPLRVTDRVELVLMGVHVPLWHVLVVPQLVPSATAVPPLHWQVPLSTVPVVQGLLPVQASPTRPGVVGQSSVLLVTHGPPVLGTPVQLTVAGPAP